MFARLGTFSHDHRRLILVLWIIVLVGAGAISGVTGSAFRDEFNLPDVESRTGFDILDEHFGGEGTGVTGTVVYRAEQGVNDPQVVSAMEELFAQIATWDDVVRVVSPYSEQAQQQVSVAGPAAGQIAYANVEFPDDLDFTRAAEIRDDIVAAIPQVEGLQVELGGFIFAEFTEPTAEAIGLGFAIVILIVAFGSVLAMGLPVTIALFSIGIGVSLITAVSNAVAIPETSTFLAIMIGLGVGIDYALLVVTRYRELLHAGRDEGEAIAIALDTAGRSVTFAGMTVVISLLGMLLMGVSFVNGIALGAAFVVLVTIVASLTLLPALLGLAGDRLERTRWRGLIAAGLIAVALVGVGLDLLPLLFAAPVAAVVLVAGFFVPILKREVPRRERRPVRETLAYRWSRLIQHHPWPVMLASAIGLLVLTVPLLGIRLGFADESNYPKDTSTRQAYELLVAGFGAGFNGPFLLAAEPGDGADVAPDQLQAVNVALANDPGVQFASPPIPSPDGQAVIWQVVPTTGPQDEVTEATVHRLREQLLPPLEAQLGFDVNVTGSVAVALDFSDYLTSRYPYFISAVLVLSFLLLLAVFRSVLVPLKAVVMNLLSIGASYGVIVAIFQWGWGSDITGVQPAPIETWAPMMLFAIVFGLSMDYEVFLLSRIREEWTRTGDSQTSVADGLAATAKVITAAALIMVVVFGSFLLETDRVFKLMGTGLAVAILLDATVVRMLLVPSTMELLGDRNWWLPAWLDRVLPRFDVEGHAPLPTADAQDPDAEPELARVDA